MEKEYTTQQKIYRHGQYANAVLNATTRIGKFPGIKITDSQINYVVRKLDRWSNILGAAACGLAIGYIIIPALGRIWGWW